MKTTSAKQNNTLDKYLVPESIALKLIDLGFQERCFGFYNMNGVAVYFSETADLQPAYHSDHQIKALAPTWDQVIEFLEDYYQTHVMVTKDHFEGKFLGWAGVVENADGLIELRTQESRYTAREAAIWQAIYLIEKRNKK